MKITEELFKLQDNEYAAFQSKLTPGIPLESFIGVRVPQCHELAKKLYKSEDLQVKKEVQKFLTTLPHKYYDENILHGCMISLEKDYEKSISLIENFLPYVDNWAVCDTMKPASFKKNRPELLKQIKIWSKSDKVYTCRFGIEMLMCHFLDEDFDAGLLKIPASIKSEEYYVNMMIAWFYATALAKQWETTVPFIESKKLGTWVHNKTIQKARESFRITAEQKKYLKSLKKESDC